MIGDHRSGSDRFAVALIVSGVIKAVAGFVFLGGVLSALLVLGHHQWSSDSRLELFGTILGGSIITASFVAVSGYVLHVLVAIYDEVRGSSAAQWRPGPPVAGPPARGYGYVTGPPADPATRGPKAPRPWS